MEFTRTENIFNKAKEIGYLNCGILPIKEALAGYTSCLDRRYAQFPEDLSFKSEDNYQMGRSAQLYPWAKAVIICTIAIGDYNLPDAFKQRIGRMYAFDFRHEKEALEYNWDSQMNEYLFSQGIRSVSSPDRGIVPLRHVAAKAGLGIIRKNNFLYTETHGSYVVLSAWLIDQPLKLIHECTLKPCPANCTKCIDACPTSSLSAPYMMQRAKCISPITSKYPEGDDVTRNNIGLKLNGWLYGCDACQEACPHNQKILKSNGERHFPRQEEFTPYMEPTNLLSLPDEFLEAHFQPRFWYMPKGSTWKWKANAICAILSSNVPNKQQFIEPYLSHPNPQLQKVAQWALQHI